MLDIKRLNELFKVALFARAWIEIELITNNIFFPYVALFARAWIEIANASSDIPPARVALFARAWIEISCQLT